MYSESIKSTCRRFAMVTVLGIGLAYIEAAVVVYLRAIFYSDGFTFPLEDFVADSLWRKFLFVEVGREAATLVVLFSSSWLTGKNFHARLAYFLTIFAVWDIFYYVWLKVILDWPASLMDWDILFLIPLTWAGPVLAPILVSLTMVSFAVVILHRQSTARPIRASKWDAMGFAFAGLMIIGDFCAAGFHVINADFRAHFYWSVFIGAEIFAILLFLKCCRNGAKR